MLITKGDLLHQTSKLERSGLRAYFAFVEVVSHKTPEVYAAILARHRVEPGRFLMVGNSLRSDVLPVVELGGWAVYVPAALSWSHEHADVPAGANSRSFEMTALDALPGLVETLENSARASTFQNVTLTASCTWRGSPTPCRRKPSKLNSAGVVSGLTLFALLNVLNISKLGMIS